MFRRRVVVCFVLFELFTVSSVRFHPVYTRKMGCSQRPPTPPNGYYIRILHHMNDGSNTTDRIRYHCIAGYRMKGERYNMCRGNQWVFNFPPRCEVLDCPSPPVPNGGGAIRRNFLTPSPVSYYCNLGLNLEGTRNNFCRNGKWMFSYPPRCVRRSKSDACFYIRCPNYALCEMGSCKCRKGFSGDGRNCIPTCKSPPEMMNAIVFPLRDEYTQYQIVTYRCVDGYKLTHPSQTKYRCFYGRFRRLSLRKQPTCKRSICDDPIFPKYGGIIPDNNYAKTWNEGETVKYYCNHGYRMVGKKLSICQDKDSFKIPPLCISHCRPRVFPNARIYPILKIYKRNVKIRYFCKKGFQSLTKPSPVHVCKDGYFKGKNPNCQKSAQCSPPSAPKNGFIFPEKVTSWKTGDFIRYECDNNYTMKGKRFSSCDGSGKFSSPTPTCLAICERPGEVNGRRFEPGNVENFFVGEQVTFRCDDDTMLIGMEKVTCTEKHVFVPPPPHCLNISGSSEGAEASGFEASTDGSS